MKWHIAALELARNLTQVEFRINNLHDGHRSCVSDPLTHLQHRAGVVVCWRSQNKLLVEGGAIGLLAATAATAAAGSLLHCAGVRKSHL